MLFKLNFKIQKCFIRCYIKNRQLKSNREKSELNTNLIKENRIKTQSELADRIKNNRKLSICNKSKIVQYKFGSTEQINTLNGPGYSHQIKENVISGDVSINKQTKDLNAVNKSLIKLKENYYLSQSKYKLRNMTLDEDAKKYLNDMKSIDKTSIDPKHLTLVHHALIVKLGNIILKKIHENSSSCSYLFEFQPGFGLLTKFLSEELSKNNDIKTNKNFVSILVESFSPFFKYLNSIKDCNDNKGLVTHVLKACPFEHKFLFKNNSLKEKLSNFVYQHDEKQQKNIIVFGIVPWNYKGYLTKLFTDYLSDCGFFSITDLQSNTSTEFYFYVPEFFLAKLKPSLKNEYSPFQSSLRVFSDIFASVELINEESCEYFYPYPLFSNQNRFSTFPYNRLNWKTMYLIRVKFNNKEKVKNKRLFYLFISHVFIRPNAAIKDSLLKSVCKDVDSVCKILGLNKYDKVKEIKSYDFLRLFNYLIQNVDEKSYLNRLVEKYPYEELKDGVNESEKTKKGSIEPIATCVGPNNLKPLNRLNVKEKKLSNTNHLQTKSNEPSKNKYSINQNNFYDNDEAEENLSLIKNTN
jgi:hypothetical protein